VLLCAVLCSPLAILLTAKSVPFVKRVIALRLAQGSTRVAGRHFLLSGVAASLAIALMTGLSLMVLSFHGTLSRWSATRLAGDLFVSAALSGNGNEGRIEPKYLELIRANPAFSAVVPYYETTSEVNERSVVVGGTDIALQCQRSVYTFLQGGCDLRSESWDTTALVSESAARKLNLAVGSTVVLENLGLKVGGILQEFGTEQPLIVVDQNVFQRQYPAHHPKTLTLDMLSSEERAHVRKSLVALAPELLIVRDSRELCDLVDTLFNRTFRVTESVRWIVFALAILGLVSTGLQYVWERRREFKTASIIGVSRATLALSVGFEVGSVALAALTVGLVTGVGIGWCLTSYINPNVFGWSLTFTLSLQPFAEAILFLLAVVLLSVSIAWRMLGVLVRSVRVADE
jgi:putative ABC transport system permease protein